MNRIKALFSLSTLCCFLVLIIISCSDDDEEVSTPFAASVSLSTSQNSLEEGNSITVEVTLNKSNTTNSSISIPISVTGSATSGQDYSTISSEIQISTSTSTSSFTITATDDTEVEGDETIIITLNTSDLPTDISLGNPNSITLTIQDNDSNTVACANDNSISFENGNCSTQPTVANTYSESINNDLRTITTNGYPNHSYSIRTNVSSTINSDTKTYVLDATPSIANSITSLTNNGRPAVELGVATNGVKIEPTPAEPFIFENPQTGEYNWDFVFEPLYNLGTVNLDCNQAHVQPDGTYHYHGVMFGYVDQLMPGLSQGTTLPTAPVQVGWAADGFPIVFAYGNDTNGQFKELKSSYRLKSGNRPGNGITEPCGEYNGKYTSDFEYVEGAGDLDECNGIQQDITLNGETFNYYYVVTFEFPVLSRCLKGTPSSDFNKQNNNSGGPPPPPPAGGGSN